MMILIVMLSIIYQNGYDSPDDIGCLGARSCMGSIIYLTKAGWFAGFLSNKDTIIHIENDNTLIKITSS